MDAFHCQSCNHLLLFENTRCVRCDHRLAWLPEEGTIAALEPEGEAWRIAGEGVSDEGSRWKLCDNYARLDVCNGALPADEPRSLCFSCRLTGTIPDLSVPGNQAAWCRLETAKRRLVYTLLELQLPLASKEEDPEQGLAFEFLADLDGAPPVLSGHANGVITLNIAEADDAERERRRTALHEPYRTLLGHFRHEIAHYYWDRLIAGSERLPAFRALFGDEREDYAASLVAHYERGADPNWQARYISAYASAHAWEDWAESWAHYLHMIDVLETASVAGLSLRPKDPGLPAVTLPRRRFGGPTFDEMIAAWHPVTYLVNNLNRSLGQSDAYPFVLAPPVIDKLRFIHETIAACRGSASSP